MKNPMNMLQAFIGNGGNPQQFVLNIMCKNPMINNLVNLMKSGKSKDVEIFANNFCKDRGIDINTEFPKFMEMVKGKNR